MKKMSKKYFNSKILMNFEKGPWKKLELILKKKLKALQKHRNNIKWNYERISRKNSRSYN